MHGGNAGELEGLLGQGGCMSKLDDALTILVGSAAHGNTRWNNVGKTYDETKANVKALMLELVADDERLPGKISDSDMQHRLYKFRVATRNELRDELRAKIGEL